MKPQHIQALGGGTLFESYAGALPREQMLSGSAGKLGASAVALGAGWKAVERGLRVAATARVLSIQIEVEDAVLEILFHSLEWRGGAQRFRLCVQVQFFHQQTGGRYELSWHKRRPLSPRFAWEDVNLATDYGWVRVAWYIVRGGTGGSACIEIGTGRQ